VFLQFFTPKMTISGPGFVNRVLEFMTTSVNTVWMDTEQW